MTKQQIKWAKQHDWYRSSFLLKENVFGVSVYDSELDRNIIIDSMKSLCEWAGY